MAKNGVPGKRTQVPVRNPKSQKQQGKKVNPPIPVKNSQKSLTKTAQMVKKESKEEASEISLFISAVSGTDRNSIQVDRTVGPSETASTLLAFCAFIVQYAPACAATDINAILGVLLDDFRRACLGQDSQLSRAPKVWWEFRQKATPCRAGIYAYSFTDPGVSISLSSSFSFVMMGTADYLNPTDITATPGSPTYYATTIAISNANYEIFGDFCNNAPKLLKVMGNPYVGKANTDPSMFSWIVYNTSATLGFGGVPDAVVYPIDFNTYLEVPVKTRWASGIAMVSVSYTSANPTSYSMMSASRTEEIGHRLFCTAHGASKEVMDCMPVGVQVSLKALVTKTMVAFQKALIQNGVSAGGVTTLGSQDFATYLIMAIIQWFSPWSLCGYPQTLFPAGRTGVLYATAGSLIQNVFQGKPLPAPLALNLSYLFPCADLKNKRVYYPLLILDTVGSDFKSSTYTVFSSDTVGTNIWTSYLSFSWQTYQDLGGLGSALVTRYSAFLPTRIYPTAVMGVNIACYSVMKYGGGSTAYALYSSQSITSRVKELVATFVFPQYQPISVPTFNEYYRFLQPKKSILVQAYSDNNSYCSFITSANNPLAMSALNMIQEYDSSQKSGSVGLGWIAAETTATLATMPSMHDYVSNTVTSGAGSAMDVLYAAIMAEYNRQTRGRA